MAEAQAAHLSFSRGKQATWPRGRWRRAAGMSYRPGRPLCWPRLWVPVLRCSLSCRTKGLQVGGQRSQESPHVAPLSWWHPSPHHTWASPRPARGRGPPLSVPGEQPVHLPRCWEEAEAQGQEGPALAQTRSWRRACGAGQGHGSSPEGLGRAHKAVVLLGRAVRRLAATGYQGCCSLAAGVGDAGLFARLSPGGCPSCQAPPAKEQGPWTHLSEGLGA